MKRVLLLFILFVAVKSFAQQTGQFDTTITFMGNPRELVMYVPANYNSANQYHLMILLHGLGDPVDDYAGTLLGASGFNLPYYAPNTIFIFPEVYNLNNDYYNPVGGEQIIQTCIDIAEHDYNIDTTNIILQGFSIGGRDALRYGLANYTKFKGLLLNTPALQSVSEAQNLTNFSYEYDNAPKIPIYITHGLSDVQYEPRVDTAVKQLILNDGIVRYFQYPGMGHQIPVFALMNPFNFIDTVTTTPGPNLDIAYVNVPSNTCSTQISSTCIVRNVGIDTIKSFKLSYSLNGNPQIYSWSGLMAPFQHAEITLSGLAANTTVGTQFVDINEDSVNAAAPEDISFFTNEVYNVQDSGTIYVQPQNTSLPISADFENGVPGNWYNPLNNNLDNWYGVSSGGGTPLGYNNSEVAMVAPLLNMGVGEQVYLIMPSADFTQTSDSMYYTLNFYESYAQQTASNNDKLEVVYSTDCGETWTSIWNQYGSTLATVSPEVVNYNTGTGIFIPSGNSQWKNVSVALNSVPAENAVIAFRATCEGGNTMFLDNVNINGVPLEIKEVYNPTYKIYPNPATDRVNITTEDRNPVVQVNVTNVLGDKILTVANPNQNNSLSINTASFVDGIYFFEVVTKNAIHTSKVLIGK